MTDHDHTHVAGAAASGHINNMRARADLQAGIASFVKAVGLTRAAVANFADHYLDLQQPYDRGRSYATEAKFIAVETYFKDLERTAADLIQRLRTAAPSLPDEPKI
jgi:hypothetical protein